MLRDWTPVVFDKRGEKPKGVSNKEHMNNQTRKGNVASSLKTNAPNKNKASEITSVRKIEKEEDTFVIPKVSLSMSKKIAQARCGLKLTQKEFALKLSVPVKTVQDYENGRAIPNHVVLNNMEKVLGSRIRG